MSQARIAACHLTHESVDGSNANASSSEWKLFLSHFFWLGAGGEWCLSANLFLALTTQFSGSLGSSQVQKCSREQFVFERQIYIFYIHYTNLICLAKVLLAAFVGCKPWAFLEGCLSSYVESICICHSFLLVETALKSGRLPSCWTQENGSAMFGVCKRRFLDHW